MSTTPTPDTEVTETTTEPTAPARPRYTLPRSLAMRDVLVQKIRSYDDGDVHSRLAAIAEGLIMDGLIDEPELDRLAQAPISDITIEFHQDQDRRR